MQNELGNDEVRRLIFIWYLNTPGGNGKKMPGAKAHHGESSKEDMVQLMNGLFLFGFLQWRQGSITEA